MMWRVVLGQALVGAALVVTTGAGVGAAPATTAPSTEAAEELPDRIDRVDLYVLLDRSGSMSTEINALKNNLATVVDGLQCPPAGTGDAGTCIPDLWAGAGTVGYSGSGTAAYQNWVDAQPNPNFAVVPTTEPASSNTQEALTFAVHAAVTGQGGAAYGMGSVPARSTCAGSPAATAGYATFGYPCFREDALPVVVLVTDEAPISGPDTYAIPNWGTVVKPAMVARHARLVGLVGDGASGATTTNLQQMATDTSAVDVNNAPLVLSAGGATAPTALHNAIMALMDAAVPPTVTMTQPSATFQLADDATAAWTATDGNGMGLGFHDVRFRSAPYDGDYGELVEPPEWQTLPAETTAVMQTLAAGDRTCWSVRTTDAIGHTSAWSAEACTGRPLDDRALSPATKGWSKGTGAAYYSGTFRKTTRRGASLTLDGVHASQLALVATTCPTCGKVRVKIGTQVLGTLSLKSPTKVRQQLFELPAFDFRTEKVRLTVTSADKLVLIDGLGVTRD